MSPLSRAAARAVTSGPAFLVAGVIDVSVLASRYWWSRVRGRRIW